MEYTYKRIYIQHQLTSQIYINVITKFDCILEVWFLICDGYSEGGQNGWHVFGSIYVGWYFKQMIVWLLNEIVKF